MAFFDETLDHTAGNLVQGGKGNIAAQAFNLLFRFFFRCFAHGIENAFEDIHDFTVGDITFTVVREFLNSPYNQVVEFVKFPLIVENIFVITADSKLRRKLKTVFCTSRPKERFLSKARAWSKMPLSTKMQVISSFPS